MRRIVKLDRAHRVLAMFLAIVMVMSTIPLSVFAASSSVLSTDIGEKEFVVGTATEFTFTTTANDDLGAIVKGSFVFSDPSAIEKLEYKESQDGNWYEFYGDFGPATGFPMTDATSQFRVTFKKAGIYTVEASMKTVEDESVLCSTSATVMVNGKSVLSTNINEKTFVVGEATEFDFTTMANDDAGKMVLGSFAFSDDSAVEKLEYKESQDGNWYEFYGDFGPQTGFPLTDNATSYFRATFNKVGTYTVTASMKEVATGDTLCFVIATVTVKDRSAIHFEMESIEVKYSDENVTNDSLVDSVSGAQYTYKSDNETVVKVNEYGILTPVGLGETTITVTRKENAEYLEASAFYTVKVVAGVQDELYWTKTVPESIAWNDPQGYTNTVIGGSGAGNVTYTSNKPEIAEVDPITGALTLKKPGTAIITATKDGGTLYDDQTASYTLVVKKSDQAPLEFDEWNPNAIYVGESCSNGAHGGSANGIIEYKSSDETIATVDGNGMVTAHRVPAGQESAVVTITASLAGDDYYEDAISITYTLTIYRAPQKTPLVFEKGIEGQKIKYGEAYANAVSGGDTVPVTYKSSDETIAKVDAEGNVTSLKAGTVTITASVPESEEYQAQTLSYELIIERADQTVTFEKGNINIPAITYGDSYRNEATAITKITYASSDSSVADVDSYGNLIVEKSGLVTITAIAEETEQYASATESYTIFIDKAEQIISFEKGDKVKVIFNENENKFSNMASSNATKGAEEDRKDIEVLYNIASGSEYIVDGSFDSTNGTFEIKGAGIIVVSVSFASNDRYAANMASYTLTVERANQTIAFEQTEYQMINGDNSFEAPTASEQGPLFGTQEIVYTIDKNEDDVVSAINANTGVLTFTNKTGKVTIRATKSADNNYNQATATYVLTVEDAKLGESRFHTIVGEKIDDASEWYISNVGIKAADGYLLSYAEAKDVAKWQNTLDNAVTVDGTHEITFYVKHIESGIIYEAQAVTIKKDATVPEAKIIHEGLNGWEKFLSIITLDLWEPKEMNFTIEKDDATSKVKKVEYIVVEGTTEVMSETALDAIADTEWKVYSGSIPVVSDEIFVVYAKVTDNAGQHIYATTNGIVFDKTAVPENNIVIDVVTDDSKGFYDEDVEINVQIEDAEPSSGINSVTYEVLNHDVLTQSGSLFQYNNDNPAYAQLVSSWDSADDDMNIIVNSEKNNSDYVKVIITVIDNAGNKTTKEIPLRICINEPTLEVTYIDDPVAIQTYKDVTYYDTNRTAKIIISGRTSVFKASDAPNFVITESKGDTAQGKTYEVVDWATSEVEGDPDAATHTYLIKFNGSANYEFSVDYTDIFGNNLNHSSNKFVVDHEKPTASITIDEKFTWSNFFKTLTFGLWKNESVTVKASSADATSPIKKFEMYRTDATEILTSERLNELYKQGNFVAAEDFTVTEDEKFVVYIRVEDYAGHYDYINSDGFVVDMTPAEITITREYTDRFHNDIPLYNDDVDILIDVEEKKGNSYSGIKEVKYWVTCDGKTTQEEVLYSFDYDMDDYVAESKDVPTYEELLHEFSQTVTIDAVENNSCNVVFHVTVTDNAGKVATKSVAVDIDVTDPEIKVEYNNNVPYKADGDRGYYPANRTATVFITERTGHFEAAKATAGIKVNAVDFDENPIVVDGEQLVEGEDEYLVDITKLFGNVEWDTEERATPDEAVHMLVLPYNYDANYEFILSYEDLATNRNEGIDTEGQVTPYKFTIDKNAPTATITVESQTWNKILSFLTFGLFSNESVIVSATSDDEISPIESIKYYKTDETTMLTVEELETITSWTDITEASKFEISNEEKFVVYLKVTDYAGNYMFINSDGYVVDMTMTPEEITITPEYTDRFHNDIPLYNGDVDVLINVTEMKEESYSGIKEVKYWVTCDGKTTQEEVLYSFEYDMDDYVAESEDVPTYEELLHEFTQTVTIESAENNSCNVVFHVTVTDNAGNVATKSVAVDIDVTDPEIKVEYSNNSPYKIDGDKGYYPANRTATVFITERTGHFEAAKATAGIKVKAVDAKENPIDVNGEQLVVGEDECLVDITKLFGNVEWDTVEGATLDEAVHMLVLPYNYDANYEFTLSYEGLASNRCEYEEVEFIEGTVTPRYFAVDKNDPTGTVAAGELGTWDKLIEFLTFGLWSKDTVDVTGTTNDVTTPIESVSYYKTSDITAKTEEELKAINSWTAFNGETGITIPADEKFVVYIRIVDYAGNVAYISTNGIIVDDTAPIVEYVKPEITITPEPANGIYNSDVTVAVSVVDPKAGDTDAYAGLKQIRYEIFNLGAKTQEGVLYSFDTVNPTHSQLLQSWSKADAIVVDKDLNNSNDVKIIVYAVDNAGNNNKAECAIQIDITPAKIDVSYDNNDGDTSYEESTYFKADRTAKIVVTERNFNPEYFKYVITNTDGYVPVISNWKTKKGILPNSDDTTHTATIRFDQDGDYKFTIESCIDIAMNKNEDVNSGTSLAPWSFSIDKTVPVVSVAYDNNEVRNGNYYKDQRIATITVTEHNFDTLNERLQIKLAATDDGVEAKLPEVSSWMSSGDIHTATITYDADSLYVFDFDYTDKAGNVTADIEEQSFYVDKTNPVLTIEKIVDESANNTEGNIGFVMTATDTNFDVFTPVLTAVVKKGDSFETKKLEIGEFTDIKNGKMFTVTNIDADGIYRITCELVDKAGNAYSEVILEKADGAKYVEQHTDADTLVTFSVNRDGSTFEIDKSTIGVVEQYYVQNVENDIVIVEINTDSLKEYTVTLNDKVLEKDKDYTVTEEGGNGAWMKYTYKVNKNLFADEGEYKLVVSSKDKADNDAFSDIKEAAVEFVVDRTAPVVTVSGIANDGRYQTDKQLVTLIPTDDGGALKTLVVNMVDEDGKVIKEVINLEGEALVAELEANGGKITFELEEGLYQNVQIICADCAVGESDATNTHDTIIKNISISSSEFMIFWANKPLRWGSIGGVSVLAIALAVFSILKKKRKA